MYFSTRRETLAYDCDALFLSSWFFAFNHSGSDSHRNDWELISFDSVPWKGKARNVMLVKLEYQSKPALRHISLDVPSNVFIFSRSLNFSSSTTVPPAILDGLNNLRSL